tara:strand:- start:6991 stop:7251 length:261 start_codon:yes stop_codon:yes gene_type:complete
VTNEEKRARAVKAKSLLDNELLTETYDTQETELFKAWQNPENSQAQRETIWNLYQGVLGARELLKRILITGNNAKKEIQRLVQKSN